MSLMEKPRDIVGGLVVMTIGAGFLMFGRELEMGTSFRMGPGYFPTILSVLMIALGAVITLQGLRGALQENSFGPIPWRGLALIIGAPLVFGFTLRGLGLGSRRADRRARHRLGQPLRRRAQLGRAVRRHRRVLRPPVHPAARIAAAAHRPLAECRLLVASIQWKNRLPRRRPNPSRSFPPWNCSLTWGSASPRRSARINLLYCFIGVLLGTAVGVLPGLGPVATIAMLLPITFGLPPVSSLIMLAGIYYGAQYGGSTTAILINLPGESSSVVTAIDGYQMAKQGRAGPALATAALGSFFAGTVATVLLVLAAPPLADVALQFGPAEYFSLMVLGLVASVALASGSLLKAFTMIVLGLLLGLVGSDVETGTQRFTFDMPEMADGLNFVALSMGVFGLGEILRNLEHEHTRSRHGQACQRPDAVQG